MLEISYSTKEAEGHTLVAVIVGFCVVGQSWTLRTVSGESRMLQTQSRLSRMLRTQSGTFQTVSVAVDCQNNAPCVFPVLWMEWNTPCLCSVQHNVPDTSTVSGSSLLSHSYIYRLQRSRLIPQSYSLLCRSVLVSPLLNINLIPSSAVPLVLVTQGPF